MLAFQIIGATFTFLRFHRKDLVSLLALPLACGIIMNWVVMSTGSAIAHNIAVLAWLAIYTVCAVTIHRLLILGPAQTPSWQHQGWTRRESLFLMVLAVCFLANAALTATTLYLVAHSITPANNATGPGPLLLLAPGVVLLFVGMRFLLVLPMAALDQPPAPAVAWRLSARHPIAIPASLTLTVLVCGVLLLLLKLLPGGSYIAAAVDPLLDLFGVAQLSVIMRLVTDTRGEPYRG